MMALVLCEFSCKFKMLRPETGSLLLCNLCLEVFVQDLALLSFFHDYLAYLTNFTLQTHMQRFSHGKLHFNKLVFIAVVGIFTYCNQHYNNSPKAIKTQ